MKNILLTSICLLIGSCFSPLLHGETIEWLTSYEQAVDRAKDEGKPIVLFFTGSDWCTWCHKLEDEALNTPEFAESAANDFVFVRLDFPMRTKQDPILLDQNKELQQKYEVRSFPSIILITSDDRQIGVTGYRPGGGQQYAEHLKSMKRNFSAYKAEVSKLGQGVLSGTDLKSIYRQAKEYKFIEDQVKIAKEGVHSDRGHFFMIERYRFLAEEGKIHAPEAVLVKNMLRKSDPSNSYLTHYQLACIEFHAYAEQMEQEGYSAELAVAPFTDYIERFGKQDLENSWRINMIIAQVYSDRDQPLKAQHYAQCAYDCAPDNSKEEIAMTLETMNKKQHVQ